MANLAISPADVSAAGFGQQYLAGEVIDAGEALYKDSAGNVFLASCNATDVEAAFIGFAGNSAEKIGQAVTITKAGAVITISNVATQAALYFLSATPGKICPEADLVSGNRKVLVCLGRTGTTIQQLNISLGVTVP